VPPKLGPGCVGGVYVAWSVYVVYFLTGMAMEDVHSSGSGFALFGLVLVATWREV
jgi:RsiW-degrading membrane proteinase PrsW (M82 family)